MVTRSLASWFAAILLGLLTVSAQAAPTVDPRNARLEVTIEAGSETPYVGEMILVTLRGSYDLIIALERFEGIELRNFSWMQLGRDIWTQERVDGREMTVVERKLAVYPQRSGELTIGPFRHHLTLSTRTGERYVHDVDSNAISIRVEPKPATNGDWWFPASDVVLTDEWDMDPGRIANGSTATRTITITAKGQTADHLPPPPKMLATGLITFIAPEDRTTEVTKDGPIAKVRWQWRTRPVKSEPGDLTAFPIPWFDTDSREMREIVIGSRRVAFAAITEEEIVRHDRIAGLWAGLVALVGLSLPVALGMPGRRFLPARTLVARLRRQLPDRTDIALQRAIWTQDVAGFRQAAARKLTRFGVPRAEKTAVLGPLDAYLYARTADRPAPDLRSALRDLRVAIASEGRVRPQAT